MTIYIGTMESNPGLSPNEMDGAEEYVVLNERAEQGIEMLQRRGILAEGLSEREYNHLRCAYHIIDELVCGFEDLEKGSYCKPGEALHRLEIYGLYQCFYSYQDGVLAWDQLNTEQGMREPVLRLYINGKLVGLSVLGRVVMNYYQEYLDWVAKISTTGVIFNFGG